MICFAQILNSIDVSGLVLFLVKIKLEFEFHIKFA